MAEKISCGIVGCESEPYEPGKGGRGGKKPRCDMHIKREQRGRDEDEPGKLVDRENPRTERIVAWVVPGVKRAAKRVARRAGKSSVSQWAGDLIQQEIEKAGT